MLQQAGLHRRGAAGQLQGAGTISHPPLVHPRTWTLCLPSAASELWVKLGLGVCLGVTLTLAVVLSVLSASPTSKGGGGGGGGGGTGAGFQINFLAVRAGEGWNWALVWAGGTGGTGLPVLAVCASLALA